MFYTQLVGKYNNYSEDQLLSDIIIRTPSVFNVYPKLTSPRSLGLGYNKFQLSYTKDEYRNSVILNKKNITFTINRHRFNH